MSREKNLTIQTPEGIVFPLQLANPVTRFLALAIDQACIYVLATAVASLCSVIGFISSDLLGAAWMLVWFLSSLGYPIATEWFMRGQTVGKRFLHLRVMDVQALRLTGSQVIVRNLLRFVDIFPAFYLVGGVASLVSPRGQRVGDMLANTIVVYEPRTVEPDLSQLMPGKFNSFRAYPHLAARLRQRVTPAEAGLFLRALLRRDRLDDDARLRLFAAIRNHLGDTVAFPPEAAEALSDEQYVRNVVDILFRRHA